MLTIKCRHCGTRVKKNVRLKHLTQHYCGSSECQKARKLKHERDKYRKDPDFRKQKQSRTLEKRQKLALEGNPQYYSQYQRSYRWSHPDYVTINREKQRERNARRRQESAPWAKIVNPDTKTPELIDRERVYAMYALDSKKIVNPDALMPERIDNLVITGKQPLIVRLL